MMVVRIYTGPCYVEPIARALEACNFEVTHRGTAFVYCKVPGPDVTGSTMEVLDRLKEVHGTTFGMTAEDFTVWDT